MNIYKMRLLVEGSSIDYVAATSREEAIEWYEEQVSQGEEVIISTELTDDELENEEFVYPDGSRTTFQSRINEILAGGWWGGEPFHFASGNRSADGLLS